MSVSTKPRVFSHFRGQRPRNASSAALLLLLLSGQGTYRLHMILIVQTQIKVVVDDGQLIAIFNNTAQLFNFWERGITEAKKVRVMLHNEAWKLILEAYDKGISVKELAMDNMKSHHAKAVKELLDNSGVRYIYLPPYSPDLNPIEKLWSKVKALLCKFKARTLDALPNAIQHAFQTVSPSDCSGWFRSCGYMPYFWKLLYIPAVEFRDQI